MEGQTELKCPNHSLNTGYKVTPCLMVHFYCCIKEVIINCMNRSVDVHLNLNAIFLFMQGNEPFTTIAVGSDRDTGYTREIKPKGEFTQRQDQVNEITSDLKQWRHSFEKTMSK